MGDQQSVTMVTNVWLKKKTKLDSRLLCNARGASRLAKRYYILIRAVELTLQGQPR